MNHHKSILNFVRQTLDSAYENINATGSDGAGALDSAYDVSNTLTQNLNVFTLNQVEAKKRDDSAGKDVTQAENYLNNIRPTKIEIEELDNDENAFSPGNEDPNTADGGGKKTPDVVPNDHAHQENSVYKSATNESVGRESANNKSEIPLNSGAAHATRHKDGIGKKNVAASAGLDNVDELAVSSADKKVAGAQVSNKSDEDKGADKKRAATDFTSTSTEPSKRTKGEDDNRFNYKNPEKTNNRGEVHEENSDEIWLSYYNDLVEYNREFGNCSVVKSHTQLWNWVKEQRQRFKSKSLREDQIAKLDELGFNWTMKQKDWMESYNELVKYNHEVGGCKVPKGYQRNPQLASWVDHQRQKFKKNSLSKECITKLDALGFVWQVRDVTLQVDWGVRYNELVEYKQQFGHCNVSQKYKSNVQLGRWVAKQRQRFKNNTLPRDRIAKLNLLGFAWQVNP
jgi:hypothetical protein